MISHEMSHTRNSLVFVLQCEVIAVITNTLPYNKIRDCMGLGKPVLLPMTDLIFH